MHRNVFGGFYRALENGIYRLRIQSDRRGRLQRVRPYRMVRFLPLGSRNATHRQFKR